MLLIQILQIQQLSSNNFQLMGNQQTKGDGSLNIFKQKQNNQYQQLKGEMGKACKCSYKTRIIGYLACFAIGWILSFIATIVYVAKHNISLFAVLFSIGQILNITGSCFLATPKTQVKDMFARSRIRFSLAYLLSTIATIVLAVTLPERLRYLVFLSLIVEIGSYFFYTLSYIPYGRKILGKICKTMLD